MTHATTVAARVSIHPHAKNLRQRVFLAIYEAGAHGATLDELEVRLSLAGNTVRPRRIELQERGLVADSGRTRLTRSGRASVVWVIPEPVYSNTTAHLKKIGLL